ncbi:MAG: tetratricopeptide repeat protein [Gemmatimonadaceae bacterium]
MHLRRWSIALAAAAAVSGGGTWWNVRRLAATERLSVMQSAAAVVAEREVRTADVAFYEARAAGDPEGAADRTHLAALYLQRARETSDEQDYLRAEQTARASLGLRTKRNDAASVVLASALLAQHRFAEARDVARQLVAAEPSVDAYRALFGETCLELGDYAGARAAFDSIGRNGRRSLSVAPRLARWAEIQGDTTHARAILREAVKAADQQPELPREQAAWFHLRLADLYLRQGHDRGAERELREGLARQPGDHRLLAAMARLAAVRAEWRDAIRYGDSAIAIVLDPATLGVVSDAYAATGDTAKASEYAAAMKVAVGRQPGAYHRAWSLYLLDHGRSVPEVLAAAQAELAGRRDINGYDLAAWALYKSGRFGEAREAIATALAQGTQDATLFYHAGMIARAAGDPAAARDYLQRALTIAPTFDYAAPAIARAVLDTLRRTAAD